MNEHYSYSVAFFVLSVMVTCQWLVIIEKYGYLADKVFKAMLSGWIFLFSYFAAGYGYSAVTYYRPNVVFTAEFYFEQLFIWHIIAMGLSFGVAWLIRIIALTSDRKRDDWRNYVTEKEYAELQLRKSKRRKQS